MKSSTISFNLYKLFKPTFVQKPQYSINRWSVWILKTSIQDGQNLQVLVIALKRMGMVSIKSIHDLVSGLYCVPICTGTIHKMLTEYAAKLADTEECIKQEIITSPITPFMKQGFVLTRCQTGCIVFNYKAHLSKWVPKLKQVYF